MANTFNSNALAAFNGHTGYDVGGEVPKEGALKVKGKTAYDDTSEIRDSILQLVGKGYTKLEDDVAQGEFARLVYVLGRPKANKLLTHILIYNNRPEVRGKNAAQRVSNYFDITPNDDTIAEILSPVRSFGTGVLGGLNNSSDYYNQQISGRIEAKPNAKPQNDSARLVDEKIAGIKLK